MKSTILIEGITYTADFLLNTKKGQEILEKLRDEKKKTGITNIYCVCKGKENPIPMHAKKRPTGGYTLGRDAHTKHLHNPECIRYFEEIKADYKNNKFKDNVEGEEWLDTYIYLNDYIVNNDHKTRKYETKINTSKKLNKALEKIITFAWYSYVKDNKYLYNPKIGELFYTIYNELTNIKVVINDNVISLNKILFKPYNAIKNKDITNQLTRERKILIDNKIKTVKTLIIGKYMHLESYEDLYRIKVHDPYLKNHYYIYTKANIVIEKYINEVKNSELYVIATIISKDKKPFIEDISFMPAYKERGIYLNNDDENKIITSLIKKNILFVRLPRNEYVFYELFKDNIPDFILLDKSTRRFKAILEALPYDKIKKNNKQDIDKAYRKSKFFKSLKNKYKLYYWYKNKGYNYKEV